ncbi:MAG: flagellar hook-length control protein FliK [Acidimicrobiia bacterium]|nr:flagellar hook-length control protein FliK [Acidimicrobiia bacterium]
MRGVEPGPTPDPAPASPTAPATGEVVATDPIDPGAGEALAVEVAPPTAGSTDGDAAAEPTGRPVAANPTVRDAAVAPQPTIATPAPTAPTAEVAAPGTIASADADPWEQLANVVRPLRTAPDGTQRMSLQLRPAELGTVHLEVAVQDGRLSIRVIADNVASRDLLASALPDLRAELSSSGVDLGTLDVSDQTSGGQWGSESDRQRTGVPRPGDASTGRTGTSIDPGTDADTTTTTARRHGAGALDLAL